MRIGSRGVASLVLQVGLALVACNAQPTGTLTPSTAHNGSPSASAAPLLPTNADDAAYHPSADAVAATARGEIITSVEIRAAPGTRAFFVVYASQGVEGTPVPVSGVIVAPAKAPASGSGYPIVAWAHATTGVADRCAPSRAGVIALPSELLDLVKEGYVLTATDYEGLGTDGIHPYFVGASEGRSVLDSIRAAMALPEAHAGKEATVIGLSQGGHATLWAAVMADVEAVDLDVRGAFAASPPTDMVAWETWMYEQAAAGNVNAAAPAVMIFGVWNAVFHAPLDFLTDAGRKSSLAVPDGCEPDLPSTTPFRSDPVAISQWLALLTNSSPGAKATDIPIRVVSPENDQAVGYATQVSGVATMCAIGDTVELVTVPGDHGASLRSPEAWSTAIAWLKDRFAGVAPVSTCGD